MRLLFVLWLLFGVKAAAESQSPREQVNFDFAWRFYLGDPTNGTPCSKNAFPQNLTGVECRGLKSDTSKSADECRSTCCDEMDCAIWQYAEDKGCWLGTSDDCSKKSPSWVGGGRSTPANITGGPVARHYDDSAWEMVDTPHDALIGGEYTSTGNEKHAYLPLNVTWYRKHFNLPTDWRGKSVWIYFEGVFRSSMVWINGDMELYHDSGYTSFSVRLDNVSSTRYGDGKENENVVAVRADGNGGSGWWYEGAGIYRHNYLVATSPQHLAVEGVYGASMIPDKAKFFYGENEGMQADMAEFLPSAEIANDANESASVQVTFTFYDEKNANVGQSKAMLTLKPHSISLANSTAVKVTNAELWSPSRPYLYQMQAVVSSQNGTALDSVNVSIGIRRSRWDPDKGFFLNDEPTKWLGFCDHNDFAGVGVGVPDRVNLFRAQAVRGVGGNSWRMSHNPPIPVLLDVLDRVGVLVWDENRQFGNDTTWVENQRDMVRRDRNHPSVMLWSFCNEGGCVAEKDPGEMTIAQMFKEASNEADPYRPVAANMNGGIGNGLTQVVDVQGFSHRSGDVYDSFHAKFPKKPVVGSECCSCRTYRGEDVTNSSTHVLTSFNADCNSEQNGWEMSRPFAGGEMVWTLFDYYGEAKPYEWPQVSSAFGSIDLAGFAKASAFWYRAWWLYNSTNVTTANPMPALVDPDIIHLEKTSKDAGNGFLVHIVEHWEPDPSRSQRTIHVYTNAPLVELLVNGHSMGSKSIYWLSWAAWDNVAFSSGNLTAVAMTSPGHVVAEHTVLTADSPTGLTLTLDAPATATGTGSALVLDGEDAALVRASIVDARGNVVPSASHNVSFSIASGPGRVIGVGNGDPLCHEPNRATWRSAYHGLARAVVQVTENHATSDRDRILQIDAEGNRRTHIVPSASDIAPPSEIVVAATVEGLGSAKVVIPLTIDVERESVLAVAKSSARLRK